MENKAIIYTDGSCHGNPGPGGYAAIVLVNGVTREAHGSDWYTTNNRMELTAVIEGLKIIPDSGYAHIISDSTYVVNPIQHGNFRNYAASSNHANADLWEKILRLSAFHTLTAEWVKGHSGNKYNQRCDFLANKEASRAEQESRIRRMVFRALILDILATPEQISAQYGKYHQLYLSYHFGGCRNG